MDLVSKMTFIVYGAGGHARVVLDASLASGHNPEFIVDDRPNCSQIYGIPVIRPSDLRWLNLDNFSFVVAVGCNEARERIYERTIRKRGGLPTSIIHPTAVVSPRARIGSGTVVLAGVVVNAEAWIGDNVILNTACSVDHDCQISNHVHLCPGSRLAGGVKIGLGSLIGTGACVIPRVMIGQKVTVGAGSVVVRDLTDSVVAYGNPAKPRSTIAIPRNLEP